MSNAYFNFSESRARHGQSAILVLTLLVQYRKYESNNPYVVKLSILDQEMALHGYSQVYLPKSILEPDRIYHCIM